MKTVAKNQNVRLTRCAPMIPSRSPSRPPTTHSSRFWAPSGTGFIFRVVWRLFEGVHGERRVRLLGIYTSGFGAGTQLDLFAAPASAADQVRDAVDRRFGEGTLTRASLMVYPERRHTRDRRGSRRLRR